LHLLTRDSKRLNLVNQPDHNFHNITHWQSPLHE